MPLGSPATAPAPPGAKCIDLHRLRHTQQVLRSGQYQARIIPSARGMRVTSQWQETRGKNALLTIYAGTYRSDWLHGAVEVVWSDRCLQPFRATIDSTDRKTGSLTLTRVQGYIVAFAFSGGRGTLDIRNHRFNLKWKVGRMTTGR